MWNTLEKEKKTSENENILMDWGGGGRDLLI